MLAFFLMASACYAGDMHEMNTALSVSQQATASSVTSTSNALLALNENEDATPKNELEALTTGKHRKHALSIERGDNVLTIGGKFKFENYLEKNMTVQNSSLPDEFCFFKNTFDLLLDYSYGEKKYDHKAVQAHLDIRHKGIWGLGTVFADNTDGAQPVSIQLSDSIFGTHNHPSSKPLLWIKDGWIRFSLNALINSHDTKRHYLKLGWFPFELGRGVTLGAAYGVSRELLGTYSYPEDKSAPGANLHGELVKDTLSYDLYYSRIEERGKSFRYTANQVKQQLLGVNTPFRGVAKNDELVAARLQWKACDNDTCGTLKLEPYVMYNEASDQKIEFLADTKTQLGTSGLALSHKYRGFTIDVESAFNFGNEFIRAWDRNIVQIKRDANGNLIEQYSHIEDAAGKNVPVTTASIAAASKRDTTITNLGNGFFNKAKRFRPAYKNKLCGWMAVADLAYTFDPYDLTCAAAYAYSSGDNNPHQQEVNKNLKEFVGLHEFYTGKTVKSVILLGERLLLIPSTLQAGDTKATQDFSFSNLQHLGFSVNWKPKNLIKDHVFHINPNVLLFWRAHASKKFDINAGSSVTGLPSGAATNENASKFMGTELNLMNKFETIKDLFIHLNLGVFIPGQYFKDIAGVPVGTDYFTVLAEKGYITNPTAANARQYRISDDISYFMNAGFEFKF